MQSCSVCGAVYDADDDTCAARFDSLLALDHSRTEPWGSRHSLAVSVYALQHHDRFPQDVLERGWLLLFSVYRQGRETAKVVAAFRRLGSRRPDWDLPGLPVREPPRDFSLTIVDLGPFAAESYPAHLDDWCKATLAAWSEL